MKNTSILVLIVLVLAVGGIGTYALLNRGTSMTESDSIDQAEMAKTDETTMKKVESTEKDSDKTMMKNEGKYVPFSQEVLASSSNSRRVLFFFANWCPTCRPADASFTQNVAQIPADVTLIRVNYNDTETDQAEKDLAKKYGVTYQHTFVQIDSNGSAVTKWNGGQIEELLSNLK